MADGYGGVVAGSWRCHCAAWVLSQNDSSATIRVEARAQAVNGWNFAINNVNGSVSCNGQSGSGTGNFNVGTNGESVIYRRDFTVSKGSSAKNVGCSATVSQYYFNGGSSSASCSVTVSAVPVLKPNPPKNVTWTRQSDSSVMCRWQSNYDNAAKKPWKQLHLYRRYGTTGGPWSGWSRVAVLNWDATNYNYTGLVTNARYQFGVFAVNDAGESTHVDSSPIYTTPSLPKSFTLNKVSDTKVEVTADTSNTYAYTMNVQRKVGDADWVTIGYRGVGNGSSMYTDPNVPGGIIYYRVQLARPVYADDANNTVVYSAWSSSRSVGTITPPLAPSITAPTSGSAIALNGTQQVVWAINHPDATEQSSAQIEVTVPNGEPTVTTINGATKSYQVQCGKECQYKVRVRTKGLHADYGAWSAYTTWTVATPPSVVILEPTSVIDASPFTLAWSIADKTGVSEQLVSIQVDGRTVLSRTVSTSTRSLIVTAADFLPENGQQLLITIRVRGGSTLTSTESTSVTVNYTPPANPTAVITDIAGYAKVIQITFNRTNPGTISQEYWTTRLSDGTSALANFYTVRLEDGTSALVPLSEGKWLAPTVKATVERVNADGTYTMIAENLNDGDQCVDHLPPLNLEYEYRITAFAASGASTSIIMSSILISDCVVFNFDAAATVVLPVGGAVKVSEKPQIDSESYHFAGVTLPVVYTTGALDNSVNVTSRYDFLNGQLHREIRNIARTYTHAWLRLLDGNRLYVHTEISQSLTASDKVVDFSASCMELEWKEPNEQ